MRWPLQPLQPFQQHNSNHLSVNQWIRSAIRDSQQPTSPIGFLFWNFRHRLVRYYWYIYIYMFLTRTSMCKWLKVYFLKHIESSHYSFIIIHEKHVTNGIVCDWVNWVYGCLWNKIRPQENTNQHIPKWGHRECLVDHQADWCWLGIINPFFLGIKQLRGNRSNQATAWKK